jgi:GNAT superfamily N-acetyltransferase
VEKKPGFTTAEGLTTTVEDNPAPEALDHLKQQIVVFNSKYFELKERYPLLVSIKDDQQVIAGISGVTFGNWLMIDYLWVDESCRGKGLGLQLLNQMEEQAIRRGCSKALLDTLAFQAKPFYEKQGYDTVFTMDDYPLNGQRSYMIKDLNVNQAS